MLGRITKSILAFLMLAFVIVPAQAKWREASSDNFVIYADSSENDVRKFAELLERFHAAMSLHSGRVVEKPSPSSRVSIYVVGSDIKLRELYGDRNASVAGFYLPRASGSVAFTPHIRYWDEKSFSMQVLLHEYAHHFLISTSPHAMPKWLSEGAAEFFGSARFHQDGAIDIGMPNNHRVWELANAKHVSLTELLDHDAYLSRKNGRYDAFYGRAWLLFHYLAFSSERDGQLSEYWRLVAGGMPSLDAAKAAFGDLAKLEKEIDSYNRRRRLPATRYDAALVAVGDISVRELSDGMQAMMPTVMRSKRGVDDEEALEVLENARKVAAQYSGDAQVLAALAEAENDAGNHAEGIAASDRAIMIDDAAKQAYVQKGFALFALAEDATDKDAAYQSAMEPFIALNRIEPDHPMPLLHLYKSETLQGKFPSQTAQAALERVSQLTPFDKEILFSLASMFAARGDVELARYALGPVAANPHGGNAATYASAIIDALRGAPAGQAFSFSSVARPLTAEQTEED